MVYCWNMIGRRGPRYGSSSLDLLWAQGDGTAAILEGHPAAMTVSFHAAKNFPTRKQRSHLDVPLPDGMDDSAYLRFAHCSVSGLHASLYWSFT